MSLLPLTRTGDVYDIWIERVLLGPSRSSACSLLLHVVAHPSATGGLPGMTVSPLAPHLAHGPLAPPGPASTTGFASLVCLQFLISISDATLPSIASAVIAFRRAAFSDLRNSASYLRR